MSHVVNHDEERIWSISVKTVGAESQTDDEGNEIPSSFLIRVKPNENIQSLNKQIESVTGLKPCQQRLIYRGRLIKAKSSPGDHSTSIDVEGRGSIEPIKISEIKGLSDGQTIHLVKRQLTSTDCTNDGNPQSESNRSGSGEDSTNNDPTTTASSGSGTSLLAALLGLNGLEEDADEGGAGRSPASSVRRYGGSNRRIRNHYRLTAEDLEVPDPGSLETVRQGLMTMHTLLPIAEEQSNNQVGTTSNAGRPNPLLDNRRWFVGQWIDCRDTVNQWLEATIIEIVRPEEILPEHTVHSVRRNGNEARAITPANDVAVGSTDFDGRQKLLLESCEEGDPDDIGGHLAGYRLRDTNEGVLLLHIHYNGWPHRWDEWIRSDSERIRPFRVRTRHPSSQSQVAPNIQSVYPESPETFMGGRNDSEDRAFLLQELVRVSTAVNDLARRAAAALPAVNSAETENRNENLPWIVRRTDETTNETNLVDLRNDSSSVAEPVGASNYDLEQLAPLIDRLGRTMVDAAPHIASLASSAPIPTAGSSAEETATNRDSASEGESHTSSNQGSENSLGGLLSLLNRERRNSRTSASQVTDQALTQASETNTIDPDYTDFSFGLVNVSRGDVRSGPRGRNGRDDFSGVLGAYLAAASLGGLGSGGDGGVGTQGNDIQGLGRLMQTRGTGDNGGIDIHIHAVVTGPGMTTGMTPGMMQGGTVGGGGGGTVLGLGLGGGPLAGTAMSQTDLFTNTRRATAQRVRTTLLEQNDEDNGIFDDLYSENPNPVASSSAEDTSAGQVRDLDDNISPRRSRQSRNSMDGSGHGRRSGRRSISRGPSLLGRLFRRNGVPE